MTTANIQRTNELLNGVEFIGTWDRFNQAVEGEALSDLLCECSDAIDAAVSAIELPADDDDALDCVLAAIGPIVQRSQNAKDEAAEEAELTAYIARKEAVDDLQRLVAGSLGMERGDWEIAQTGSCYAKFRGLKIRVSDHRQVAGGGFNEALGIRMGEADCDFTIDHNWTREAIRNIVSEAIYEIRRTA
jgi:hypothetical protein